MAFALLPSTTKAADGALVLSAPLLGTVAAGGIVRKNAQGKLTYTDTAATTTDDVGGVCVGGGVAGQTGAYVPPGHKIVTSGLTPGMTYYVGNGADAGKVGAFADAEAANAYATVAIFALSATVAIVLGLASGAQV